MFVLVVGRNKSGKSKYAEGLTAALSREHGSCLVYMATMVPYGEGEEGAACIARHRKQREELPFETVERPLDLAGALLPGHATILLEDVSNLLANNLFGAGAEAFAALDAGSQAAFVAQEVQALIQRSRSLVAVSIQGLLPGDEYDGPTNRYIELLNEVNALLFEAADAVVEMREREPHVVKGRLW